jgi:hypothetical protein
MTGPTGRTRGTKWTATGTSSPRTRWAQQLGYGRRWALQLAEADPTNVTTLNEEPAPGQYSGASETVTLSSNVTAGTANPPHCYAAGHEDHEPALLRGPEATIIDHFSGSASAAA